MNQKFFLILSISIFIFANFFLIIKCQSNDTTTAYVSSTTVIPDECNSIPNATCTTCLNNAKCFFCAEDNTCRLLKIKMIFPEGCSASKARWFDCSLNFEALLIGTIAVGVIILLILTCCVCYCCSATCKAITDSGVRRAERKLQKQRNLIKARSEERKQERTARNEAIRVKYGLKPATYAQME